MTPDTLTATLTPKLKEIGFRKRRLTWYREQDGLTLVFAVLRSQFGSDLWYYSFGIGLHALTLPPVTTISKCQIREQTEMRKADGTLFSPDEILHLIRFWAEQYGDIRQLRIRALQNRLPKMTEQSAVSYLTKGGLPWWKLC
jgi:hypothetical protein